MGIQIQKQKPPINEGFCFLYSYYLLLTYYSTLHLNLITLSYLLTPINEVLFQIEDNPGIHSNTI